MLNLSRYSFTFLISLYALLYFVDYFSTISIVSTIISIIGLCAFLISFVFMPIKKGAISLLLTVLALALHLIAGNSIVEGAISGFNIMSGLITLLLIVPMISWVLREKPYIESVIHLAQNLLNTSRKFYFGMLVITQMISYFLLFGAIPMVYQMVNDFMSDQTGEAWENYKGTALLRGFALTTMWVISIPSFVFAVSHLDASLFLSILQGAILSFCGVLLAVVFSYFQEKRYGVNITEGIQEQIAKVSQQTLEKDIGNREALEFLYLFISLFGTIFLLNAVWDVELLLIIPIVIIFWVIAYFLITRRMVKMLQQGKVYVNKDVANQAQQFSILLAAGFLIDAVEQSGYGQYLVDGIFFLTDAIPFLNFLWVLPFVVILLGFIGLGPLTVIVLVSGILQGVELPYPPEIVVLGITSGSVISIMLSPLILPVIVLSASNGLSILKNGIRFNFAYAIAFYFLVQLYLQLMVHFVL